jgi:succinoglycan biosynthesis transport protein ExoP
MKQQFGLLDYYQMIIRKRWILLFSVLGCLAASILYMAFQPPVYMASSTFSLEPVSNKRQSFSAMDYYLPEETRPIEYYQAMINSRQVGTSLIQAILKQDTLVSRLSIPEKKLETVVATSLSLFSSKYTNFVQLTARANDPNLAFTIASEATDILKNRCQEVDREEQQNAVNFIEEQKLVATTKLEEAEHALNTFREKSNLGVTSLEDGGLTKDLVQMENQLTEIQTEKQLAEANLAAYSRRLSQIQGREDNLSASAKSPQAEAFREEIAKLETQRSQLAQSAGPEDGKVKSLERQIEEKKRNLINLLLKSTGKDSDEGGDGGLSLWKSLQERKIAEELNVFVLENRERYYQNLIAAFKRTHPNLLENTMTLIRLTRAKSVAENLYSFLLQRGEESKIQAATGTGGISIIDRPAIPRYPVPVNTVRNLTLALMFGLGMGFGVSLVLEYIDNTFRSQEDVTTHLKIPVMGLIPDFKMAAKQLKRPAFKWFRKAEKPRKPEPGKAVMEHPEKCLITHLKPKDPVVESYRSLRSNMQFASVDSQRKSILVSSPNPGDGKTVTAANLGIIFSMLGQRVLIVDADLRKPKQHKMFGLKQSPGLTEALVENLAVDKVIQNCGVENLKIIASGKIPPNPAEILSSQKMTDFIEKLEGTADLVIYDSPPLAAVTDAMILVSKLHGLLLVLRHQGTNRFQAGEVLERILKAKGDVIGAVLNRMNVSAGYGYYSKYYHKGYY